MDTYQNNESGIGENGSNGHNHTPNESTFLMHVTSNILSENN